MVASIKYELYVMEVIHNVCASNIHFEFVKLSTSFFGTDINGNTQRKKC